METINKPFAPFGAMFHQLLSQKIKIKYAPFLFCGKYAYQEAKASVEHGQLALCLPMGCSFESYAWPIHGMRLIIYDTGSMSSLGLYKLAHGVLKQGASVAAIHSPNKLVVDVFTLRLKKELQHGKGDSDRK